MMSWSRTRTQPGGTLVPMDYALRSTDACLIYPSVRHMRPAVRAFTDFAVPRIRAVEGISPTA